MVTKGEGRNFLKKLNKWNFGVFHIQNDKIKITTLNIIRKF